jgi:2-methylcitrate dehydratase PrpD
LILQHTVVAAFLFGAAGLAQYEDDCVADPAVRALHVKVVFDEDRGAPVESATVTLHLADRMEQSEHIRHGRGTPGRPMSDAELDTKVRARCLWRPFRRRCRADRGGAGHRSRGRSDPIDAPNSARHDRFRAPLG